MTERERLERELDLAVPVDREILVRQNEVRRGLCADLEKRLAVILERDV